MASTYSNLKIQLMGTGENSGTWGNVTNTNLGTAIEEAIVGSADVTFSSGTVTLTLTDSNATQTARNLRLNLTGTSGGAQNLIVPAIEKVYIVNNGCADAITVKNSTGTGIAVPAGKTMYVYNNGTNVVDAVTHLTSLTLTTPLANSQTTASSSNGASTIVARDSSGNFAANTISANLTGTNVAATTVTATNGAITNVTATNVTSTNVATTNVTATNVGATTVTATNGAITNVTATNVTATNVTSTNVAATNFTTTNFTITQSGSNLLIKYGATTIVTISSTGAITAAGDITSSS